MFCTERTVSFNPFTVEHSTSSCNIRMGKCGKKNPILQPHLYIEREESIVRSSGKVCIEKKSYDANLFEACHRLHSAYAATRASYKVLKRSIAILCSILDSCFILQVPFTRDGNSIAQLSLENVGTRGALKEFRQAISFPAKGKLRYFVIQRNLFKKVLLPNHFAVFLSSSKIGSVRSRD